MNRRVVDCLDNVAALNAAWRRTVLLRLGHERTGRLFQAMLSAMSGVTDWICTPIQPRVTLPLSRNWATTLLTVSAGMANAMPTEPPDGEKIAVLTPITLPSTSKVGPPELPLLTGASIWMKSS